MKVRNYTLNGTFIFFLIFFTAYYNRENALNAKVLPSHTLHFYTLG